MRRIRDLDFAKIYSWEEVKAASALPNDELSPGWDYSHLVDHQFELVEIPVSLLSALDPTGHESVYIDEMVEAMRSGHVFVPILYAQATPTEPAEWVDGNHRLLAAQRFGAQSIRAFRQLPR